MRPIYKVLEMVLAGPAFGYTCHAVEDLAKFGKISKKEEKATLKFIEKEVEAYCKKIDKSGEYKALINCFRSDPKYADYYSEMVATDDPFYVQVRKEWLESKIAKLKAQIRKPKVKTGIQATEGVTFKVGDKVRIARASEWPGFVPMMHNCIGSEGRIVVFETDGEFGTCFKIEGNPFWFPIDCLEHV